MNHFPDPVAAYDRVAAHYDRLAESRRAYLASVENLIVARVPPGSRTLLDIGGGSGRRGLNIARQAGIEKVVLLEPSDGMRKRASPEIETWTARAEELDPEKPPAQGRRFDVIICLWNVLGHIPSAALRLQVLIRLPELLSPRGVLFIDVNHRYNANSYGFPRTALRFLRDRLRPGETNGDVTARWQFDGETCSTYGHVFTGREMEGLAKTARLKISERLVVDYDSGKIRRFSFQGNLLYVFRA